MKAQVSPPFKLFLRGVAILFVFAALPARTSAQRSDSAANTTQQTVAETPAAALRDLLSAACSQDAQGFATFLTPRNAQAFARLTGAARVALMKRLVLLDEPGKPTAGANPSGRPIVRCEARALSTEMQIGGADVQENLAFLPLTITNLSDPAGADARQIRIGLIREAGSWKLLSVGLLLLDLPSLEIEWNRASMEVNERDAIQTLKNLVKAIETYRRSYAKLPEGLAKLGPPRQTGAAVSAAGLVDAELAAGTKNGYSFRYVIVGASAIGAPAKYELAAVPQVYGTTGRRSFLVDESGVLHGADRQGAVASPADALAE